MFPTKTETLKQFRNKQFAFIRSFLPGLMIAALLLNIFSYSVVDTRVKQKGFTVSNALPTSQSAENLPEGETSEEMETEIEDDEFDHVIVEGVEFFIVLKIYSAFHYGQHFPELSADVPTPPPAYSA